MAHNYVTELVVDPFIELVTEKCYPVTEFQIETNKLHGPLMLEIPLSFSLLFHSLVGMVLIEYNRLEIKNELLVVHQ